MTLAMPPYPQLRRGQLISDGLVGCWPCYERSGKILHDMSGANRHAQLYTAEVDPVTLAPGSPAWVASPGGSAVNPNGTDQVFMPPPPLTGTISQLTIMFWALTLDDHVAIGFTRDENYRAGIVADTTTVYYLLENAAGHYPSCPSPFATDPGGWCHFALTYTGIALSGYLNGAVQTLAWVGGDLVSTYTVTGTFTLGAGSWHNDSYRTSLFDARVYNRALSPPEIAQIAAGFG